MLKKIIFSGAVGISLAFSGASSAEESNIYAIYQKDLDTQEWSLAKISSEKPKDIRVGIEEVLVINNDDIKPLFHGQNRLFKDKEKDRVLFDCKDKGERAYNACYSNLTRSAYSPGPDISEDVPYYIKTYDKPKIMELVLNTKTPSKIQEFKESLKEFQDIKILADHAWLDIIDSVSESWKNFKKDRSRFVQKLKITDMTNLFPEGEERALPNLFYFNDEFKLPEKPYFLTDEYLEKLNPKNHFSLYKEIEELRLAKRTIYGKANRFKKKILDNMATEFTDIHLTYKNITYKGWELKVSGPKTVKRLSSNKKIPIDVVVLTKTVANAVPDLEANDEMLKIKLTNGDITIKNISDKKVNISSLEVSFNGKKSPLKINKELDPGKEIGFNLFDRALIEEHKFDHITAKEAAYSKLSISIKVNYKNPEGSHSIDKISSDILSNIIRKYPLG